MIEDPQDPQPQDPQPLPADLRTIARDRLGRMLRGFVEEMGKPVLDEGGRVVEQGMPAAEAGAIAKGKIRDWASKGDDVVDRQGMAAFLSGQSDQMPMGWLPTRTPRTSQQDIAEQYHRGLIAQAERARSGGVLSKINQAVYDYAVEPASRYIAGAVNIPMNVGIGLLNAVPGVDIDPWDTRAILLSGMAQIAGDQRSEKERIQAAKDAMWAMQETSTFGSGAVRAAADTMRVGKSLLGNAPGGMLNPANLGKAPLVAGGTAAAWGASKLGLGKKVQEIAALAGGFATYEAITARSKTGGKPSTLDTAKALGMGAAAGLAIAGASAVAKAALRRMFRSQVGKLGPDMQQAKDALVKWGREHRMFRLANEPNEVFLRRLANGWVDGGMEGAKVPFRRLFGYALQGGIQATSFSMLDMEFNRDLWDAAQAAWHGDWQPMWKVTERFFGTALGLGALHMSLADIPAWQRRRDVRGSDQPPQAPQEPAAQGKPTEPAKAEAVQPSEQGGAQEAGIARPERTRPQAVDPATLKPDPATGTLLAEPLEMDMARFGWERVPMEAGAPAAAGAATPSAEPLRPEWTRFELPGTAMWFEASGELARPSPALREALQLPEGMTYEGLVTVLDQSSLLSALRAKLLPGTEIEASGTHAEPGTEAQPGVMRTIRMGEVLEAPLGPDPQWQPAGSLKSRGRDQIDDPAQKDAAEILRMTMAERDDLPQASRVLLDAAIDVVETVAARNDRSVEESVAIITSLRAALNNGPTVAAERAVRAIAEVLTVKAPEIVLRELQRSQEIDPRTLQVAKPDRPESPQVSPGEAGKTQEPSREGERGAVAVPSGKPMRETGEVALEALRTAIQNQIDQLAAETGDQAMAERMRKAYSRSRTFMGDAFKEFDLAEADIRAVSRDLTRNVEVGGVDTPRWVALAQGQIKPESPVEAKATDALRKTFTSLWNRAVEAENVLARPRRVGEVVEPGKPEKEQPDFTYFRATPREVPTIPRVWDEGYDRVYQNKGTRQRWFQRLVELNPPGLGERPLTVKRLEREYQEGIAPVRVEGAKREAALEHIRYLRNVPFEFEGQPMLVRDPFESVRRTVVQQAGRVAAIEEFGQEGIPEPARKRLALSPEKKGVEPALAKWFGSLENAPTELMQRARETVVRIQGGEPIRTGKVVKAWNNVDSIVRASMTMLSGVRDIPSILTEGVNAAGLRKTLRAVGRVLVNYKTERQRAIALGTLLPEIGNLNLNEATGTLSKIGDWIGEWGNVPLLKLLSPRATERLRTVTMSRAADLMLNGWREGVGRAGSQKWIESLGIQPADAEALVMGRADAKLEQRFRHDMVENATSRGLAASRSRAAANPYVRSLIRFSQYATKRLYGLAREAKLVKDAWNDPNRGPGDRAAAIKRLTYRGAGFAIGGVIGDLLYYVLADAIEVDNGLEHYIRDVANYPGKMLGRAITGQVVAGPLGLLWRSAWERPQDLGEVVAPVQLLTNVLEQVQAGATPKGWLETAYDTAAATGAIPQAQRLKRLSGYLNGIALGNNPDFAEDAQLVRQFDQLEGIKRDAPDFNKQRAFYAAVGKIRGFLDQADMKLPADKMADQVRAQADAAIREALALQPEESLAGSVRAMQHADHLTDPAVRQKFQKFAGDARFERIMQHDAMVQELASDIGQMQGTNPTPFAERLDTAASLAAGGSKNAWNKIVQDAVEDAGIAFFNKQPTNDDLQNIAHRMSLHPESVLRDETLPEKARRWWASEDRTQQERERMLYSTMRERVGMRAEAEWKKAAKQKRDAKEKP